MPSLPPTRIQINTFPPKHPLSRTPTRPLPPKSLLLDLHPLRHPFPTAPIRRRRPLHRLRRQLQRRRQRLHRRPLLPGFHPPRLHLPDLGVRVAVAARAQSLRRQGATEPTVQDFRDVLERRHSLDIHPVYLPDRRVERGVQRGLDP